MSRPPARKEGDDLKPFVVADNRIMYDFEGNKVFGGDKIMLTKEQAQHYQKTGFITFDMGAIFDDNGKDAESSGTETSSGDQAEPSGTEDDGDAEQSAPKPKRRSAR